MMVGGYNQGINGNGRVLFAMGCVYSRFLWQGIATKGVEDRMREGK